MDIKLFEKLFQQQLVSDTELAKIKTQEQEPVSVHWDMRTLLYLGILLLTTGIGIIVYKNIDTIGHDVIVAVIAVACAVCFAYCLKNAKGYSNKKIESVNIWFDYVLLLGCLLLLTFIAYIQFQYYVFGNRLGMATFIPMVLLFIAAYYFDHLGVLSLAITNLAAWAGISATPLQILEDNDFNDEQIIYTGLVLGSGLVAFSFFTKARKIKAHFEFTYKNFGVHILSISCLAAMFYFESMYLIWFVVLAAIGFSFFKNALKENSFYFLVITMLYTYIGLCYVVIQLMFLAGDGMGAVYLGLLYFIASGFGLIRLFIHYNKIIKKNDGI
ncbi:MAG: DUF2157 domain-containing protein [Panacibacter sp.]